MRWFQAAVSMVLLTVAGCGSQPSAATSPAKPTLAYPYTVVTTCGMVTNIVQVVAGEKATVKGLMGEGVDPHLYKPTRNDVKALMDSDIVFYSGLMLEGRMADAFTKVQRSRKPVYAVTEQIDESFLREPPEFEGHTDPHVWMDVAAWSECVGMVGRALAEFDEANAEYYQQNAAAYQQELVKLDEYAKKCIATIPEAQRVLVTAHDAFGYFSRAYGIEVKSVQGLTTESEPGVEDIVNLVDFVVKRKIKAIFVESSVSSKNIQAVIEAANEKGWELKIGGQLYSDAMGAPGSYEGTYVGMMDHNVTVITRSLGGKAPELGLNSKLSGAAKEHK